MDLELWVSATYIAGLKSKKIRLMQELPVDTLRALLNQIADGNDKAVRQIYVHYQPALYGFIRHLVSDESAVEEILQDTFMVLFRKPESWHAQSKFFTWLCGIAKNKVVDWRRSQSKHNDVVEDADQVLETIPATGWDMLATLEAKEMSAFIAKCINCLPQLSREAIYRANFLDERVEDIAILQKCPVNTVKTRLFHARIKLKECIEKILGSGGKHACA